MASRENPVEEFRQQYERAVGVPLSRSTHFSELSESLNAIKVQKLSDLGKHLPEFVNSWKETYEKAANNPESNPENREKAAKSLARLNDPAISSAVDKRPDTSFEAGRSGFKKFAELGVKAARSRQRFEDASGNAGNILYLPTGADFYPMHHGTYEHIAKHYYGSGLTPEHSRNLILAGTPFSAGVSPQVEVQGASGLGFFDSRGKDIGFKINHTGADRINSLLNMQQVSGKNKRVADTNSGFPTEELTAGTHSFANLHPAHKALIAAHVGGAKSLSDLSGHIDVGSRSEELREAGGLLVGAAGTSGVPAIHKAFNTLINPAAATRATNGPEQKVATYSPTTLISRPEHAQVIRHLVGAYTHGDRYWKQNPQAATEVSERLHHPAFRNPFLVSDIHHARATSGLDPHLALALGDTLRPDARFTTPASVSKHLGVPNTRVPHGSPVNMGHLAYLAQEQMGDVGMSVHVPGFGKYRFAPHIEQAMGWIGIQGSYPAGREALKRGTRSLIQQDVDLDPTKSLNPHKMPHLIR